MSQLDIPWASAPRFLALCENRQQDAGQMIHWVPKLSKVLEITKLSQTAHMAEMDRLEKM